MAYLRYSLHVLGSQSAFSGYKFCRLMVNEPETAEQAAETRLGANARDAHGAMREYITDGLISVATR